MPDNKYFSKEELIQYQKHLLLPEIGESGQLKLKNAKILIVGVGGLGCPVLQYLSASGIGNIIIIDDDVVSTSNLQRQILYGMDDVGKLKIDVAQKRAIQINPHIKIEGIAERLTSENVSKFVNSVDIIIDCSDNFKTRYLINDVCIANKKPFVYGALHRFEGQVSVFNLKINETSYSPSYRDLFPVETNDECMNNCADTGVMGVIPGLIGSFQAIEAIKIITKTGIPLAGKLLIYNSLNNDTTILKYGKSINHKTQQYPIEIKKPEVIDEIESIELSNRLKDNSKKFELVDVREPIEKKIFDLAGKNIPLSKIVEEVNYFRTSKNYILYCQSGIRSKSAIKILLKIDSNLKLHNLKGGATQYSKIKKATN